MGFVRPGQTEVLHEAQDVLAIAAPGMGAAAAVHPGLEQLRNREKEAFDPAAVFLRELAGENRRQRGCANRGEFRAGQSIRVRRPQQGQCRSSGLWLYQFVQVSFPTALFESFKIVWHRLPWRSRLTRRQLREIVPPAERIRLNNMPLFNGWKLAISHPQKFLMTRVRARGGLYLVEALFN